MKPRHSPGMEGGEVGGGDALHVLHVDMDCFFAAVEVLDDPSLARRPVIVGGTGLRGVVAACSYEARATGVRSAMPMSEARRRCPSAVVIGGRHDRYGEVSRDLHGVFQEFTPVVEPISLDEAFLDVAGSHKLFGSSVEIAWAIRERVQEVLNLECSVGVGRSKLISKLASRAAKPRATPAGKQAGAGVVVIEAADEIGFLWPRPVSDLWGVGPKTADRLSRFGIHTIEDLAALDEAAVIRIVGKAAGPQLLGLAFGRDPRPVEASRPLKSVGHEETFSTDRYDETALRRELVRLSDSVGSRLRAAGVVGRTVTLKLRFADFATITRSHSITSPLESASEISQISQALLAGVDISPGVRLIGVTVSSLEPRGTASGRQLALIELAPEQGSEAPAGSISALGLRRDSLDAKAVSRDARGEVDSAIEEIRKRFGRDAVGPAVVAGPRGLTVKRLGDAQWGPNEAD